MNDFLSLPTRWFGKQTAPLWPISIARVLMGLLWLFSLRWKLPPDFESSGETSLAQWLDLEVEHAAFGFYGSLIENVVIPNFTLFAWGIFLAELAAGLSLLLGVFTRAGALLGLAMAINLGIGLLEVPGEWPWSYLMLAMWHATILVSNTEQQLNISQWATRQKTTSS